MFEEALNFGIDLNAVLAQELNGLALAPIPVNVSSPPKNILVNRVPEGFTPILINLQRCSRADLRRFLHSMLCSPATGENGTQSKEKPLGKCGCELLEFDYQPDFLFNKRKNDSLEQEDEDGYSSNGYSEDTVFSNKDIHAEVDCDGSEGEIDDEADSEDSKESIQAQEAERNRIKIKRPPNSFMIYRSERHNELVREYRGGNKVISGIIAKEWHSMSPEKKKKYEDMAAIKKHEHEMLYPNYKFMPKRRKL
ncbi:hypothetical protein H4R99_002858 [Coemansia sp. RSA 1722]|nr:hypothetical protein H4R99_002858 [Coemansia sp. RSA 1722]KAJ2637768.1 hypothetical protein GGF40_002124 [Coemansia sp. RSA 1286]